MTNAEKIRSMSDNELAEFLIGICTDEVTGATYMGIFEDRPLDGIEDFRKWLSDETKL